MKKLEEEERIMYILIAEQRNRNSHMHDNEVTLS